MSNVAGLTAPATTPLELVSGAGLDRLAEAVGNARVVLLGEATHGDGATFAAKAAIVRYLHEHAGFDLLAWEAGVYDCRRMDDAFATGVEPLAALALGVHSVWVTEEVRSLAEHISASWKTDRPLRQVGFDTQFSSVTSVDTVGADVARWMAELAIEATDDDVTAINALAAASVPFLRQLDVDERSSARAAVRRLLDAARSKAPDAFVVRVLDDVLINDDIYTPLNGWVRERKAAVGADDYEHWVDESSDFWKQHFSMRDRAMADNLLRDLADRPDARIVCWLANGHAQRNMHLVGDGDKRFDTLLTMGTPVCNALGDDAYVIVTTSHSGGMRAGRDDPRLLPPAAAGSLEDVLHETAGATAFLDARTLPADSPWRQPSVWRSWGQEQNPAPLPEIADGVLYIDVQRPWHGIDET